MRPSLLATGALLICSAATGCGSSGTSTGKTTGANSDAGIPTPPLNAFEPAPPSSDPSASTVDQPPSSTDPPGTGLDDESPAASSGPSDCPACNGTYDCTATVAGVQESATVTLAESNGTCVATAMGTAVGVLSGCVASGLGATGITLTPSNGQLRGCANESGENVCLTCTPIP